MLVLGLDTPSGPLLAVFAGGLGTDVKVETSLKESKLRSNRSEQGLLGWWGGSLPLGARGKDY